MGHAVRSLDDPLHAEPAQWLLLVWLLVRWIRVRDDRLLLVSGPVAGLAAMTQFGAPLLCAVLVAAAAAVARTSCCVGRYCGWAPSSRP